MRCEECGLIQRPDIASAMKEERCKCDVEFEKINDKFNSILDTNQELIDQIVRKISDN